MALIIKQLVIRGEVIDDSTSFKKEEELNYEKMKHLLENMKREIESQCMEKISSAIGNTLIR